VKPVAYTSERALVAAEGMDGHIYGVFHHKPANPDFHVALVTEADAQREVERAVRVALEMVQMSLIGRYTAAHYLLPPVADVMARLKEQGNG
jgi:hypothetical protein